MSARRLPTVHAGLVAALLAALAAAPGAADWLVLEDGSRVETRGAWEERGKLIVFTTAAGELSSLRAAEVDLEASRAATEEAKRPAAAPPAATAAPAKPLKPAFVLTDADVRRAPPDAAAPDAAAAAEGGAEGSEGPAPPEAPEAERLVVTEWQEEELAADAGVRLTGTLRNRSEQATTQITLTARIFAADGRLAATGEAELSTRTLMPGRQTRFQIDLPGLYSVSAVKFETESLALETGSPEGVDDSAGAPPISS